MSDELNVWRDANGAFSLGNPGRREQAAAAVIRTYGDRRYQQAIADVVEWLREGGRVEAAEMFTRRFGKDA